MRKLLLMCQLFLGTLAMAQVSYTEDWTNTGLNNWTSVSEGGSFTRNTTAAQICGTAGGTIRSEQYYGTSGQFTSPALTGNNEGLITMAFDYKITNYGAATTATPIGNIGTIKVEYASSASGPWTTAYTIDASNHTVVNTCATKTVTFNPAAGSLYVRFNVTSNINADVYYYFDNVVISQGAAPTCLSPSGVTASAVTVNSANLAWTAPATLPGSGYEYYLSTSNTSPTAATSATGTSSTTAAPLSGLASATTYYVWVRSVCSTSDKSSWSSFATFTTPCSSTNVPYTLDFTGVTTPALPNCTTAVNYGTGNTWNTYNLNAQGFTGNVLNYTYNSSSAANTWFFTQGINLTAGTSYRIKYKYGIASGTVYPENLKVAYGSSASNSAMTNPLADYPGISTSNATSAYVDFIPSATGVYYFGFQAYSAADMNRLYVDDINIDVTPTCSEPTAVTTSNITINAADIAWTAPATAPGSGYEIYYSTTNTAPTASTSATVTGITGTSKTLSSLNSGTLYYVWVRSVCTATDKSVWSSMVSFTTLTPPPANDECSNAVTLIPGGSFAQNPIQGSTSGSTNSSALTASCLFTPTNVAGNVWYKVTVPASGSLTIETDAVTGSALTDTVLSVFADCSATTSIGCDDDSGNGAFSKLSLTGQTPGATLYVSVWRYYSATDGAFQISAYDSSLVLATNEVKDAKNNIKVYPNPFSNVLNISDAANVKNVLVTDVSGRLLKTIANPSSQLHLEELKQGMYMITLEMKDGSKQTIKTIKKD